jgi:3-oxo-5-alpha-steroid 4-dehydrogenase 1
MGAALSTSWGAMPSIQDFSPPTPAAYTGLLAAFQYFPVVSKQAAKLTCA